MSVAVQAVQVFILAENRLLREALARILNKKSDLQVVAAAAVSPDIVGQIGAAAPDVLLCDSSALALYKLHLIVEVRAAVPGLKVIMIGMEGNAETFLQSVREGVVGYVLKDASALEVAAAVRAVANEEAVCPPTLCRVLFHELGKPSLQAPPRFAVKNNLGLTRREQQLVQMIGRGLTNKEIATQLNLSEQTVKNHIHRMLRKLGANDRQGAFEIACMPGVVA